MTKFGEYLEKKSVNKAEISRKTGITRVRLTELSTTPTTKIRGEEIYLVALAIDVSPCEMLEELFGHLKLSR